MTYTATAMAIPTTAARPRITPAVIPPADLICPGPLSARKQRERLVVRLSELTNLENILWVYSFGVKKLCCQWAS